MGNLTERLVVNKDKNSNFALYYAEMLLLINKLKTK